jgi:S1-C subfamily serine protease
MSGSNAPLPPESAWGAGSTRARSRTSRPPTSKARPGGPADEAGLRGGDVIVEFAGLPIKNLQDYSDALIGAKIGEPVDIVVLREGERVKMKITPTSGK